MKPLFGALCIAIFLAGCEDVVQIVQGHPDDMKRLGRGEVQVMERKL